MVQFVPKVHKLVDSSSSGDVSEASHPFSVNECLLDSNVFVPGQTEAVWCNVHGCFSLQPTVLPKLSFCSIAYSNCSAKFEQFFFFHGEFQWHACPRFVRFCPFVPRPAEVQCTIETCQILDAKAPQLFGTIHPLPVYQFLDLMVFMRDLRLELTDLYQS